MVLRRTLLARQTTIGRRALSAIRLEAAVRKLREIPGVEPVSAVSFPPPLAPVAPARFVAPGQPADPRIGSVHTARLTGRNPDTTVTPDMVTPDMMIMEPRYGR
jgi:hypothetical protein